MSANKKTVCLFVCICVVLFVWRALLFVSAQTWRPVDGQVSKVAAFNELHRHASRGGIVGQSYQQLGDTTVRQRLSGGGAVTRRHGRQAQLGGHTLRKHTNILYTRCCILAHILPTALCCSFIYTPPSERKIKKATTALTVVIKRQLRESEELHTN